LSHKDARVHCVVLNIRAALPHTRHLPSTLRTRGFDGRKGPRPYGPKGIEAFARAFRTQQRVRRLHPTTSRSTARRPPKEPSTACTNDTVTCQRQIIDVPPLSTCCPTLGDRPGPGPDKLASAP